MAEIEGPSPAPDIGMEFGPIPTLDDAQLIEHLSRMQKIEARMKDEHQRIEHELIRRMERRHAKEIYHPEWTCELQIPSPNYDIAKLRGRLGEVIPPEVWDKGFREGGYETVYVEAKFDMRVVKGWVSAYGDPVQEIVESAMLPKPPRVKVERRK